MELKELSTKIQIKLHQFSNRFCLGFSRPDRKFLYQMLFGILKGGKVQLNSIARHPALRFGVNLRENLFPNWSLGTELSKKLCFLCLNQSFETEFLRNYVPK